MSTSDKPVVAFIGLGGMGTGMAQNILRQHYPLIVWNRSADKTKDLAAAGAKVATSAREAAAQAEVVISCLMGDKSVHEVTFGHDGILAGLRKGKIHVGTSTISTAGTVELENEHKRAGCIYLCGAVLGRPNAAAAGKLRSFLGGEEKAVQTVMPVVQAYSASGITVFPTPEHAAAMKLIANFTIASLMSVFGQAYTLADGYGLDTTKVKEFLDVFIPNPNLSVYSERIRTREFQNQGGMDLQGALKDVKLMLEAGERVGVPLPFASVLQTQVVSSVANGNGAGDWAALSEASRIAAGQGKQALAPKK